MNTNEFIPVEMFCRLHSVEVSFMGSIQELGMIEIIQVNEERVIPLSELPKAEKIIRLHNDLQINAEGIDVVIDLLQKMKDMQTEMEALKGRMGVYEIGR